MTRGPCRVRAPLVALVLAALGSGAAEPGAAAEAGPPVPPKGRRTASWYEANPVVMRRVLAVCRDDPGHAWNDPDCINARAAELRGGERHGRRVVGASANPFVSPADPRYWIINPGELPGKLGRCATMPPEAQRAYFCDAARAAAGRTAAR